MTEPERVSREELRRLVEESCKRAHERADEQRRRVNDVLQRSKAFREQLRRAASR